MSTFSPAEMAFQQKAQAWLHVADQAGALELTAQFNRLMEFVPETAWTTTTNRLLTQTIPQLVVYTIENECMLSARSAMRFIKVLNTDERYKKLLNLPNGAYYLGAMTVRIAAYGIKTGDTEHTQIVHRMLTTWLGDAAPAVEHHSAEDVLDVLYGRGTYLLYFDGSASVNATMKTLKNLNLPIRLGEATPMSRASLMLPSDLTL